MTHANQQEGETVDQRGSAGVVSIVGGFDPFQQAFHHITNCNPACSAPSTPALAGRGRGVIPPRIPSSPFITLSHLPSSGSVPVSQQNETTGEFENVQKAFARGAKNER